jgi:serine/threonine protein kinase
VQGKIYNIAKQARSLVSGELVATKQVNIEQHEGDLESIRLEIQILSKCCHPNVVQYLGSYIFDDILWINLEYVMHCGQVYIKFLYTF